MKEYLKTKGIRLAVAVAAVVVVVLVLSLLRGGRAAPVENAAGAVTEPVRKAAASVVDWLEGIYGYLYEYDQLKVENETLRAQLAQAQEAARTAGAIEEENARLRELLNMAEKHTDFVFESAKIVSWNASNWASTFTIGKGESSGIELGDCVVTEYEALVGQVIELGSNWATVRTVIDTDMDVGALVGEIGSAAMAVGDFSMMQEGRLKLTYLSEGTQLVEGDQIVTSGKGGSFPQGLLIGTIYAVQVEAGGQTPFGVIEPACDLGSVSQVFVIKDYNIAE